jgi:pimeloyl-ACP methyl ester carboxylesterase
VDTPTTRYARNGAAHLAYQVVGDGPIDIVLIESWVHHVEAFWAVPELARQRRRLAAIGRLVIFDRRGTGLSDPVGLDQLPDLDTQVDDLRAVMDAAGMESAAILGFMDGSALALRLAATSPERCRQIVLFNATARYVLDDDYPYGMPEEMILDFVDQQSADWAAGDPGYRGC